MNTVKKIHLYSKLHELLIYTKFCEEFTEFSNKGNLYKFFVFDTQKSKLT